jgi:hypothetical protein
VFFSDSTGPCYHTAQDEADIVDYFKLGHQSRTALRLARELADADEPPAFTSAPAPVTYEDAVALQVVAERLVRDIDRFTLTQQARLLGNKAMLDAIVAAGPAEFGADDITTIVVNTAGVIDLLTTGPCDGFLRGHGDEDDGDD